MLDNIRAKASGESEKGRAFENLMLKYLSHDPVQKSLYSKAYKYSEWAKEYNLSRQDTGIDLVAKLHNSDKYCAVQCKFYAESHTISKPDLDSFFAASGTKHFARRLIIDTTHNPWSNNAEQLITVSAHNNSKPAHHGNSTLPARYKDMMQSAICSGFCPALFWLAQNQS